jgi:penicillin-binding protein 2A
MRDDRQSPFAGNDDEEDRYRHSERSRATPSRVTRMGSPGNKGKKKNFFSSIFNRKVMLALFVIGIVPLIGGYIWLRVQAQDVDLEKMVTYNQVAILYDANGKEIDKIGKYQNEFISLAEIKRVNPDLPEAFVKVEDVRFYQHHGVDYKSLLRALVANIKAGRKVQGGGTITMQVARNVIIEDREKTYTRKLKEIATAWKIEEKYGKDKILETYLNYIYFGNNVSGVKMAAKVYFNKDITNTRLTAGEIAYLAGLPKAPSEYNLFGDEEEQAKAKARRAVVLQQMAEENEMKALITKEEEAKANEEPLSRDKSGVKYVKQVKYAAYKQLVLQELKNRYGIIESQLQTQPYQIYTGLNPQLQIATEEVLRDPASYRDAKTGRVHETLDAGSATIDVNTGLIAAIGGGRDYTPTTISYGSQGFFQPGSAIKPLTVYAPAIEKGLKEEDGDINEYYTLPDEPIEYGNWIPKNYTQRYYHNVKMGFVVEQSLNAGTVWLLHNKVGLDIAYDTANELGLDLKGADRNLSPLALGGLTKGITPLQLARAYTVFPTNGIKKHAVAVKKVELNGTVTAGDVEEKRVFSETTAWWMTRMLRNVVENGTARHYPLAGGRPSAGKTGTVTDNKNAAFAGYTPDYVTAVVVFNKTPAEPIQNLTGGEYPARIFKKIMDKGLEGTAIHSFTKPPHVQDPVKPFQLVAPEVVGAFDPTLKQVMLKWQPQSERVKYEIWRTENRDDWGSVPYQVVQPGATQFIDSGIEIPQMDPVTGQPITPAKTYYYKVVAIDTRLLNRKEAKSVQVKIEIKSSYPLPWQPNPGQLPPEKLPPGQPLPGQVPPGQPPPLNQPSQGQQLPAGQLPSQRP